jgi:hypothetical protein
MPMRYNHYGAKLKPHIVSKRAKPGRGSDTETQAFLGFLTLINELNGAIPAGNTP